jgi:hypothetical protein
MDEEEEADNTLDKLILEYDNEEKNEAKSRPQLVSDAVFKPLK